MSRSSPRTLGPTVAVLVIALTVVAGLAALAPGRSESPSHPSGLSAAWTCPTTPGTWVASNVSRGPAPLAVAFCASSNGSATNESWYFGDGGTAYGSAVTHTFTAPGAYDVRVQLQGPAYNQTEWAWVFATGGPPVALGVAVTASSYDGSGTMASVGVALTGCRPYCWINWTASNSSFSTQPSPMNDESTSYSFVVTVGSSGPWTIAVVAGDPLGDAGNGSAAVDLTGNSSGFAIGTIGATATTGPAPLATTFYVNFTGAVGNVTAAWSFGDGGNGTGLEVTHTYTSTGVFTAVVQLADQAQDTARGYVNVTVTSGGENGTPLNLTLHPVEWAGSPPFAAEFLGSLTGGTPPYAMNVSWGDGSPTFDWAPSGGGFGLNHTFVDPGNYTVTAFASDGRGHTAIVSVPIFVVAASPLVVVVQSAVTVGPGPVALATLLTVAGGSPPYTIQYAWGDGTESSGQAGTITVHLYTAVGVYHPTASVRDAAGHGVNVTLAAVNVTSTGGTVPAGGGGGLLPSGTNGWGMIGTAAAVGVGVGVATAAGLAVERRRRTDRKEGQGIASALESEAVGGPAATAAAAPEDVKRP